MTRRFPAGFLWGAFTAAYQIEGAVAADGRGPCIWDTFCRQPGKIKNGDTGDIASDHYRRFGEDVELLRQANLNAYRFSVSWSRIFPSGAGRINKPGLDFYDRLLDRLAEAAIAPWMCLYHWDLPQSLEDKGGWLNRDVAGWYADYAQTAARRLGDRLQFLTTFAEPHVAALKGYGEGLHAPGIRGRKTALQALHHMNLAHGLAVQAIRAERSGLSLGNIYGLVPAEPGTDRSRDREAAELFDAFWNRACSDPQILGSYPEILADDMKPYLRAGDLSVIAQPLDYLAFAHNLKCRVLHDPSHPFGWAGTPLPLEGPRSTAAWDAILRSLLALLKEASARYGNLPVYIAGDGSGCSGIYDKDVQGGERIDYLRALLIGLHEAIAAGVPVRGCFAHSLLDGFEWTSGYSLNLGLVHVERGSQVRRPKDIFDFFAECAGRNEVES